MDFLSYSTDSLMQVIEQLRGGGGKRLKNIELRAYMEALIKKAGEIYQTYSLPEKLTIHRARWLPPEYTVSHLKREDLGPPSRELVTKYGRCHQPKNPVCYCSLHVETALAELDAQAGEHYLISTFHPQRGTILMPVGDFDYYCRTGQTLLGQESPGATDAYEKLRGKIGIQELLHSRAIDAFIAEAFIKRAGTHADYKITSTFSKIFFDEFKGRIDALLYPSVAFREGTNFAFSIEAYNSKLNLSGSETRIIEIKNSLGFGIYEYEDIYILNRVNPNGALEWNKKPDPTK